MKVKAILFDMDGTLTVPCLDFEAMRAEMGVKEGYILEAMAQMTPDQLAHAQTVLDRHEVVAAKNSQLQPGTAETLGQLRQQGRSLGVITRNCHASVDILCERHGLRFDVVLTREDGPVKPEAYPVLKACELLGIAPLEAIMVGDYLHDMVCGQRAGAYTVLLSSHPNHRDFHGHADFVMDRMEELLTIIDTIENTDTLENT